MLHLLTSPAWAPPGQAPRPLPLTLPGALLVVLATQARWVARDTLAAIFWPDAAPPDALHHLRINLHRARGLLDGWGVSSALLAERSRVQLALPSDLAQLRQAQAQGDAAVLQRLSPAQWLHGWRLPGYGGFAQWCDDTAQQLHADWLAAGRRTLPAAGAPAPAQAAGTPAPPGRDAELHRLLASPAPALLLLGEPGAGKTTLLRAAFPQAPCLRGLEGLHAMPYRPLLDVLRAQAVTLERALREPGHPLRPYRLDLARVLPELAPDEPLPPLDALTAQARLVEALARAFEALTPVLLVDDLQWCDAATVEWLLMLAHSGRLRWRAAVRPHEIAPALAGALQHLRSAARLEELAVPPLSREALALACQARWPWQAFSDARLDRLHALSGGNAFLVGELVATGLSGDDPVTATPVAERVAQLVRARLRAQPEAVRRAVELAAVFVQAVPAAALCEEPEAAEAAAQACSGAVAAGLLREDGVGYSCRHDLIRHAIASALPAARHTALHRHAALWLAPHASSDALNIAEHWRHAGEPQTALAWRHRGAAQLKERGRFEQARTLWREVADDSLDAAQALRARLELAACDLFEDLARGEIALNAVRAQLGAVADAEQHRQIETRVLAALVDNRVFAGDIARAQLHATRLRELLPALHPHEQVDALEVLIELAMRTPDIDGAWALLARLRAVAPKRPTLLSFEGQIHWFGGQVQAAHDALARLLERHPDHCRGITVENDLAVMLQALGRIEEAEAMARRSLQSWAGVAHTETLSLLVLGLTLTSAGRFDEADATLQRALALAREQASPGFEAEARVRRARLLLARGDAAAAQAELDIALPLLQASPEPLRVSQLVLAQVQAAAALGRELPQGAIQRLQDVAARSDHPLVQVRLARVQFEAAWLRGDRDAALQAAERQAAIASAAGLQESAAEAQSLRVRVRA
jgi:tetratricopeptide (TPR) repeat protein